MAEVMTFMVEDAKIKYLNFGGRETMYNAAGQRNFVAVLPEAQALAMSADGWNVRRGKLRDDAEEGEEADYQIEIAVKFGDYKPPRVVMISSSGRTNLDADSVDVLDWVNIQKVDFIAREYQWSFAGKSGVKAYLQTMFVTIEEDDLEKKYGIMEQAIQEDLNATS